LTRVLSSIMLVALASASNCQYIIDTTINPPVGMKYCHVFAFGTEIISQWYECVSETEVSLSTYSESGDCTGTAEVSKLTKSNATFDCSPSKPACSKVLGFKLPCGCDILSGQCEFAAVYGVVDGVCFQDNSTISGFYNISCDSKDTYITFNQYHSSDCSGIDNAQTRTPGCLPGKYTFNLTEEVVLCNGIEFSSTHVEHEMTTTHVKHEMTSTHVKHKMTSTHVKHEMTSSTNLEHEMTSSTTHLKTSPGNMFMWSFSLLLALLLAVPLFLV